MDYIVLLAFLATIVGLLALMPLAVWLRRRRRGRETPGRTTTDGTAPTHGPKPYRASSADPDEAVVPHAIACAYCGRPIEPKDPISLMYGRSRDVMPMEADPDKARICCMRTDCAPDATSFAGHWDGTKPVWKFGGKTMLQHTFTAGGMVFGNIGRLGDDD